MLKSKNTLPFKKIYYMILLLSGIIILYRLQLPRKSLHSIKENSFVGTIERFQIDGDKLTVQLKGDETVIGSYFFHTKKEMQKAKKEMNYGDKIRVQGKWERPSKNTTPNIFNYQKYLEYQNIFYSISIKSYQKLENNKNPFKYLRQVIQKRCQSNPYLETLILGDKTNLSKEVIMSYQQNGISHLLALSGMHVSFLATIILKILLRLIPNKKICFRIINLLLCLYLMSVNLSPSILRAVLFFLLYSWNKRYQWSLNAISIFFLGLALTLLWNPYYIFNSGFAYSFSTSLVLISMSSWINKTSSKTKKSLKTSYLAFLASLPINLYNFYEVNLMSIFYNLLFIPFVTSIIFPLALLTILCPWIMPIFDFFTKLLESSSLFLSSLNHLIFTFPKLPLLIYIGYIINIVFHLYQIKYHNRKKPYFLLLFLILHFLYPYYHQENYVKIIDVGQGDSILLSLQGRNILIDTGGKAEYLQEKWRQKTKKYSIVNNITIPLMKSLGIKKLNYLILTHGDFDHMGESINLVNNFKVDKVIFNNDNDNELELKLMNALEDKKIAYYKNVEEINLDDMKLYFLNTDLYDNENDNSNVIYFDYNNYQFLFMGDASIEKEKDILDKYNLKNIDFLKVGHHGSNTSSSKKFIDEISPKYSIISVGKNNRYGHPNKEVLNNLEDSKIYRTDQDGSIMFKIKNNKLKIETCSP